MNTSSKDNYYSQEIIKPRHNGTYDLLVIAVTIVFIMTVWLEEIFAMNVSLMVLYFICTYVQVKEKHYANFFFFLTFFLFLLDTIFFGIFDQSLKYKFQSAEIEKHVLLSLGIAIIGVYVGSVVKDRKYIIGSSHKSTSKRVTSPEVSGKMRAFLKYAYLFAAISDLANAVAKAFFVSRNSYIAYYLDYETPLPYFMKWFAGVAPLLFCFYLGSMPSKKDTTIPVIAFLSVGITALFYGQRNSFFVRALVVLCYYLLRNKYSNDGEVWITKRQIRLLILALPFVIAFMSFWRSYRMGVAYGKKGLFESVIEGLLNQGGDIAILDYEYRYRSLLPNKPFALGGIIGFLHNNVISRMLGIRSIPARQNTVDIALNGYSFSAALMYQQNRNGFLMGFGIGSCYIAELFFSFGYIGVFVGSYIYGRVLKKLTEVSIKGFIFNGYALFMFQQLLMAPRATFDGFISSTFQVAHIFLGVLCWFLSARVWPKGINDE